MAISIIFLLLVIVAGLCILSGFGLLIGKLCNVSYCRDTSYGWVFSLLLVGSGIAEHLYMIFWLADHWSR